MIFKVLTYEEVEELNNDLRSKLPGTAKVRYVRFRWGCGFCEPRRLVVQRALISPN